MPYACPPPPTTDRIQMGHGSGGRQTQKLLEDIFYPAFANDTLLAKHDAAALTIKNAKLAFTTDSFVIQPLFFPGGDIGELAVTGTINDLAMAGARPLYLSAGFILEEGLELSVLRRVVESMGKTAKASGAALVTGDTKVVDRARGDGLFINTAGIGERMFPLDMSPSNVRPGDAVILSGDIGRHGMAVMSAREGLGLESDLVSDCAALWPEVEPLAKAGITVHCLRDLTRGGLASALNEIATAAGASVRVEETAIPVLPAVASACELLGLDPLYTANEGRFVAFVPEPEAARAVHILSARSPAPRVIGHVAHGPGRVTLKNTLGMERLIDLLYGDPMPRIC
jgi:hydrogenase expression/formation protein HypE